MQSYIQAEDLAKKALEISEALDKKNPIYLACCNNLALIYKTTGKYEEALVLYESVYLTYLDTLGNNHKSTITLQHNLASTYRARRSPDIAIKLLENLPKLSAETLQIHILKASCFKDIQDYNNAKAILDIAENFIYETYGKGNVVSVNLLNCKGIVHKSCGEFEIAEKYFKE